MTRTGIFFGIGTAVLASFLALGGGMTPPSVAAPRVVPPPQVSAPAPHALDGLRPGLWAFAGGTGEMPQRLCVKEPAALIQLQHGATACTRFTIASAAQAATVHYSCPGAGWGRTALRVENAERVRIDTQGVAANRPFAWTVEAHREGACA